MPKLKTKRGAAKRFRVTAKGYKHKRTNKNHLFIGKSTKRKRQLRGFADVSDADRSLVDRMLPGRKRRGRKGPAPDDTGKEG